MTQDERVIKYINDFGSISPMEAFMDLGVTKLATIVSRLRKEKNMVFFQEYLPATNRYGEKCYYMRYWLDEKKYQDFMLYKDMFLKED